MDGPPENGVVLCSFSLRGTCGMNRGVVPYRCTLQTAGKSYVCVLLWRRAGVTKKDENYQLERQRTRTHDPPHPPLRPRGRLPPARPEPASAHLAPPFTHPASALQAVPAPPSAVAPLAGLETPSSQAEAVEAVERERRGDAAARAPREVRVDAPVTPAQHSERLLILRIKTV
jgi:hypothetical protein